MVVLGNPPYSGHSANKGEWIKGLLKGADKESAANYFMVDGAKLKERQVKWLHDDYVKFIRFGQWRIEKTGSGILAFVTNHRYIDNRTFRGMRQALMDSFSEIYILDLHGNTRKKECPPDDLRNDNVFDDQQGVAIGIFVKRPNTKGPAKVYYAELWGSRQEKYDWLSLEDVASTTWKPIDPATPFYLFIPIRTEWLQEYNLGWRITDAMPVHSVGIVSGRDDLTMKSSSEEILRTVRKFSSLPEEEARELFKLGKDARDWKVSLAQKDVVESGIKEQRVVKVLYRPFDVRFTYYTGKTKGFLCMPMYEVMRHMLAGKNIGLSTTKSIEIGRGWEHIFSSTRPIQHHTVSLKEVNYLFPLYLYPASGEEGKYARSTLIQNAEKAIKESGRIAAKDVESERDRVAQLIKRLLPKEHYPRVPNLNPDFINDLETRLSISFVPDGTGDLQSSFGPEDMFRYMYAILHSPTYRVRYSEFLRTDFPRIPLVSDLLVFRSLCSLGKELLDLHLLRKDAARITSYPVKGDHLVDQVRYSEPGQGDDEGRVWINKTQYFKGIPPEVWDFHVGGYQICEKWLKDRKRSRLSFDDLEHYQKIVSALAETIRIMGEIDSVIEGHGGFPIQ